MPTVDSTGLANFIDDFGGNGGSAALTFGSPIIRPKYFFQNYFVQDTWKLRSNLTLSLGVRYENAGTPENSMPFPRQLTRFQGRLIRPSLPRATRKKVTTTTLLLALDLPIHLTCSDQPVRS